MQDALSSGWDRLTSGNLNGDKLPLVSDGTSGSGKGGSSSKGGPASLFFPEHGIVHLAAIVIGVILIAITLAVLLGQSRTVTRTVSAVQKTAKHAATLAAI